MLNDLRENIIESLENGNNILYTPVKFSIDVEQLALNNKIPLLDSLQLLVDEYGLDETKISKLITNTLKEKIALENNILDYVPDNVLPI